MFRRCFDTGGVRFSYGSLHYLIPAEPFKLVDKAMDGEDVWFTQRGQRSRIVPEVDTTSKLSRITPLDLINPDGPGLEDESWKDEMMREWEKKWDERLPRARV